MQFGGIIILHDIPITQGSAVIAVEDDGLVVEEKD